MSPLIIIVVIVVLVVAIGLFAITAINRLRHQSIQVEEAEAGIDVQLTRRSELIPNLIETVKGYMGHERQTLEAVTNARAAAGTAGSVAEKAAADAQMQQALANLFAVAEAYPDLKASTNFQQLQAELTRTEDQLAFARQYFNDAVSTLNTTIVTIPWSMFVGIAGVSKADFYDAPEANLAVPEVDFDSDTAGDGTEGGQPS